MKYQLLILATVGMAFAARAVKLDGIAAIVDQGEITMGEVAAEAQRRHHENYSEALNALIERKLILKAAAEKKMEMQEWVVDNRVREIVHDSFGDDRNKLEAELAKAHVAMADWRKTIREDMIVNAMRWQIVDKNLAPTPAQMQQEYKAHPERYAKGATTTVRVILLRPSTEGEPGMGTRGDDILEQLDGGADFGELAKKHSSDSQAAKGGLWQDIVPRDAFRAEIAEAIDALKPGTYSRLVRLGSWGFIVKKESETKATVRSFLEAYEDIAVNVRRQTSRAAYDAWIKRLKDAAYVKIFPIPESKK